MKHIQLKSFTLTEVIVAMVITSLLSLAAYSMLHNTGQIIELSKDDQEENADAIQLYTSISFDIAHASEVKVESTKIEVLNAISPDVQYSLENDMVVRHILEHTDTFHVELNFLKKHELNQNVLYLQLEKEHKEIPVAIALPMYSFEKCNKILESNTLQSVWK